MEHSQQTTPFLNICLEYFQGRFKCTFHLNKILPSSLSRSLKVIESDTDRLGRGNHDFLLVIHYKYDLNLIVSEINGDIGRKHQILMINFGVFEHPKHPKYGLDLRF